MPAEPVVAPTFTDEEREAARSEWLRGLEPEGQAVPEVDLVRWTNGWADYSEAVAGCLSEAGFAAVADASGGIRYPEGVPEAQEPALWLASYVCNAKYTPDPKFLGDWTEAQLGVIYDYFVEYFIPCMDAHGISVSQENKPTREAYIATFFDDGVERWWPTSALHGAPEEVVKACPELPNSRAFYGG